MTRSTPHGRGSFNASAVNSPSSPNDLDPDDVASWSVAVTLCTYNERDNIAALIQEIRRHLPQADVLVVDDNSPDGTADLVRSLAATDPQIHLLLRSNKEGLGAATIAGFQWVIARNYDAAINLDADFSHPPERLPDLLAGLATSDVCIGSRYVTGGSISGWPLSRHVMSRGVNWLSQWLLALPIRDCSGAYRAYRVSLLRNMTWSAFRSLGYAFQEEMLFRCRIAGARIVERPIHFADRRVGTSKINGSEIVRAIRDLWLCSRESVSPPNRQQSMKDSSRIEQPLAPRPLD